MNADATSDRTAPEQFVVGFDGAQDMAPAKADRVLRECLSLTHKRLEAAIWSALEELQDAAPQYEDDAPPVPGTSKLGRDMASAVRRQRAQFFPRFKAEFDKAFQKRREGKRRTRMQRDNASLAFASTALAIVDHGDHSAQVALKSVVLAMRDATQEDALAFDFRVRVLLREVSEVGTFDNPWSADYYCDAFGNACRGLWPEGELWRPIMDHLVRATTPHVAALHRELNVLLQDRDVLPAVRLRTHARGGAAQPADLGGRALYDKLVEILDPGTRAAPSAATGMPETAEGTGAVVETASGNTPAGFEAGGRAGADDGSWLRDAQLRSVLVDVLNHLQRGAFAAPLPPEWLNLDRNALLDGAGNQLPALKQAFAGKAVSPIDLVTIEIVAGVLDYVFDDPYLPDEIKAVFGRLQIPILKAALLDRGVLSNPRHPTRLFLETLAKASVDLQPESANGRAVIELASRLALRIRDNFDDDLSVFETAKAELDAHLDAERAEADRRLDEAVPPLIAEDERAEARAEAQIALGARLAGRSVPPEVRAFLDHECIERLATICLEGRREEAAWEKQLAIVDDLLWSIQPKTGVAARKRLVELLPPLLRSIDRDWPTDAEAQARRQALLSCLLDLHLQSMKAVHGVAATKPAGATGPPSAAAATPIPPAAALREPDEYDERVQSLVRGDWCEFKGEDGETSLARLAWRAPQRQRLLFSHRDGTTAFVYTPEGLAEAFRSGRATLAIEAAPLFERAMTRLVARRAQAGAAGAAPAAQQAG